VNNKIIVLVRLQRLGQYLTLITIDALARAGHHHVLPLVKLEDLGGAAVHDLLLLLQAELVVLLGEGEREGGRNGGRVSG